MSEKRPSMQMVVSTVGSKEFQAKVAASLPPGVNADRFTRMTITALQSKPELLEADKDSLYMAILQCAQTGLAPDGKEAALVVFNTKVGQNQWIKKVQFMPMVTGVIKKLGEVEVKCDTEVVYAEDFFEYEAGDNAKITHRPAKLGMDRGVMIGAYAILRMKGIETPYREVMDSKAIEAVRAQSKSPDSLMWKQFPGEAYRKTVLRRCAKRIPMRFDESVEATLNADNETYDMSAPTTADPTVVAEQQKQLEMVTPETDSHSVGQPQPVESENPAPKPEAVKRAVANKPEPTPRARPAALSAVVAAQGDNEDIF